jgi:hypothetical protein
MRTKSFSDQIRAAIDNSGQSRYRLCKSIGLAESAMSRFMAGQSGLSLNKLDKLAAEIDLHVVAGWKGRK